MKLKSKGKVHPSPPPERDALSVLKALPAAILALAMLLSLEDREVLAYLISRSLNTTTTTNPQDPKKKQPPKKGTSAPHRPARFGCDCFDCYTSYWFRWDSSPSRELINEAIEAFEDHLAAGERPRRASRGRRRDRNGWRVAIAASPPPEPPATEVLPRPDSPERAIEVGSEAIGELPAAAKLTPGVLGSIKSRIWGFWNPNRV